MSGVGSTACWPCSWHHLDGSPQVQYGLSVQRSYLDSDTTNLQVSGFPSLFANSNLSPFPRGSPSYLGGVFRACLDVFRSKASRAAEFCWVDGLGAPWWPSVSAWMCKASGRGLLSSQSPVSAGLQPQTPAEADRCSVTARTHQRQTISSGQIPNFPVLLPFRRDTCTLSVEDLLPWCLRTQATSNFASNFAGRACRRAGCRDVWPMQSPTRGPTPRGPSGFYALLWPSQNL